MLTNKYNKESIKQGEAKTQMNLFRFKNKAPICRRGWLLSLLFIGDAHLDFRTRAVFGDCRVNGHMLARTTLLNTFRQRRGLSVVGVLENLITAVNNFVSH